MIHMKHCGIKYLLFFLFHTTAFGMEQAPLHALAGAFHPSNEQVALLCSDLSLKIWNRNNMTMKDISLASIKTEFDNQNIHSIKYDKDDANRLFITLYTPSGIDCLGFKDLVTAKTLTFNITTTGCEESVIIENFAQNMHTHQDTHTNYKTYILKSTSTITGYNKDNILFANTIVGKKIHSCALYPNNHNEIIVAASFGKETHFHNLATYNPFLILKHPGTHSTTLNFSDDGTQLLIGKHDGSIDFYALKTTLYYPTENKPAIERLALLIQETTNINPPTRGSLIKMILCNPLCTFKALWHNTAFTTKTITTLALIGALWLGYTKYITAKI